jgi:hypothetical protein
MKKSLCPGTKYRLRSDYNKAVSLGEMRGIMNLKKPDIVIRDCLRCGIRFESESPSNRICKLCKASKRQN